MHIVAGKLRARGFEVIERVSGDEITEVTIINPKNRGAGTVRVGYDGYVTWEWLTGIGERSRSGHLIEVIARLLSHASGNENGLRLLTGGTET
jgi:hypothetical protein